MISLLEKNPFKSWLQRLTGPVLAFWIASLFYLSLILGPDQLVKIARNDFSKAVWLALPLGLSLVLPKLLLKQALVFLQGLWGIPPFAGLANLWVKFRKKQYKRVMEQYKQAIKQLENFSSDDTSKYRRIAYYQKFIYLHPGQGVVMPTLLGDISFATNEYTKTRYGFWGSIMWPRLSLLIPQDLKSTLEENTRQITLWLEAWLLGLIFLFWVPITSYVLYEAGQNHYLALVAIPFALGWLWLSYQSVLESASEYAELYKSAFDLYRKKLYENMGWPIPQNLLEEKLYGEKLERFIQKGVLNGHGPGQGSATTNLDDPKRGCSLEEHKF